MAKKKKTTVNTQVVDEALSSIISPNPADSILDVFEAGTSIEKEIVLELLSDDNLDRKTELKRPFRWAGLGVLEQFLAARGLDQTANSLRLFTETSFRYLISKDRKGRREYVEALQTIGGSQPLSGGGLGRTKEVLR